MPYTEQLPHAGSAEVLFTGMFDEPAGTVARTIPRRHVNSNSQASYSTTGQVAVTAIPLPAGLIVNNIMVFFGTTGATGPTHLWHGLLDAQLNVLAVSADQGAAAQTATTAAKLAMLIPYLVTQTGLYYIATSSSAATTAPTLSGINLANSIATTTLGAPILCGTAGNQATPPAVGTQLASGIITAAAASDFAAWIS